MFSRTLNNVFKRFVNFQCHYLPHLLHTFLPLEEGSEHGEGEVAGTDPNTCKEICRGWGKTVQRRKKMMRIFTQKFLKQSRIERKLRKTV